MKFHNIKNRHKNNFFFFFFLFRATSIAYGHFQARGWIGPIAAKVWPQATATLDPSHFASLHHISWQHWILNPLRKARDWTPILMDPSQVHFCWATTGTPFLGVGGVCPHHEEVPQPGIEPMPQQQPETRRWQCWTLNTLSHEELLKNLFPIHPTCSSQFGPLLHTLRDKTLPYCNWMDSNFSYWRRGVKLKIWAHLLSCLSLKVALILHSHFLSLVF